MTRQRSALFLLIPAMLLLLSACAGNEKLPLSHGEDLIRAGSYDGAVNFYMERLSESPQSIEARLLLVRALRAAAKRHAELGAEFEKAGRLEAALIEYQTALNYNTEETIARQGVDRVKAKRRAQELLAKGKQLLEKGNVREAAHLLHQAMDLDSENPQVQAAYQEASERSQLAAETAARASGLTAKQQALHLLSNKPVTLRFKDTDITEVLEIISKLAEVNILVDEGVRAKRVTSYIKDLPLRQAFGLILSTNRLFAKQVNDNSLIVIPDIPAKHRQYDDLQVRTFYLSNADAKGIVNLLRTILSTRQIFVDEELNTVTIRDTPDKITLAQRLIYVNDRGGGEVEIDLEILEVDRTKLRNFGITFTDQYQAAFFVPPTGDPLTAGFVTLQALGVEGEGRVGDVSIDAKMLRASGSKGGLTRSIRPSFSRGIAARFFVCPWRGERGVRVWVEVPRRADATWVDRTPGRWDRCISIRPIQKTTRQTSTRSFFLSLGTGPRLLNGMLC